MLPRAASPPPSPLTQPLLPSGSSPRSTAGEPSTHVSRLNRALDSVEEAAGDLLDHLQRLKIDSGPSMKWLTGALGASVFAGGMAYSVQEGGNAIERGFANSVAVSGAGLYFSGVRELLLEAQACGSGAALVSGAVAAASAAAVLAGSMMFAAPVNAVRTSGLVVLATGIHGTATKLTETFILAHHKLGLSTRAAVYQGSPYISVLIGVACLAAAAAVALIVFFFVGKVHVTSAMVAAASAGASACLDTCGDFVWQLWEEWGVARGLWARARAHAAELRAEAAAPATAAIA